MSRVLRVAQAEAALKNARLQEATARLALFDARDHFNATAALVHAAVMVLPDKESVTPEEAPMALRVMRNVLEHVKTAQAQVELATSALARATEDVAAAETAVADLAKGVLAAAHPVVVAAARDLVSAGWTADRMFRTAPVRRKARADFSVGAQATRVAPCPPLL
jgi:hypothetical protein